MLTFTRETVYWDFCMFGIVDSSRGKSLNHALSRLLCIILLLFFRFVFITAAKSTKEHTEWSTLIHIYSNNTLMKMNACTAYTCQSHLAGLWCAFAKLLCVWNSHNMQPITTISTETKHTYFQFFNFLLFGFLVLRLQMQEDEFVISFGCLKSLRICHLMYSMFLCDLVQIWNLCCCFSQFVNSFISMIIKFSWDSCAIPSSILKFFSY